MLVQSTVHYAAILLVLCHFLKKKHVHLLHFDAQILLFGFPGPDPVLKPPISLMCQQPPQPFQAMTPTQNLRPPPVMMPDPLPFPHCTPLTVKPPPHLQLPPNPPIPAPPVISPKPPEEDAQAVAADHEATLEELCKPLYCKLCNVTLNSAQQAQAHYQVI